MQEGLLRGLVRAPWWRPGSLLSKVEVRGKEGEGKSSNSEWHVEPAPATTLAPAKPKPREGVGSGGLSSLALGPRRNLVPETLTYFTFYSTLWGSFQNINIPRIFSVRVPPSVQRYDLVPADPSLADRADLSVWASLQPLKWWLSNSSSDQLMIWPDVNTANRTGDHT